MIPRHDPPSRLLALAAAQEHVLTSEQCQSFGVSRHALGRLVSQGRLHRITPGIYTFVPGDLSWVARCWTGVLLGGDRACIGGEAAGHLHEIIEDEPRLVSVLVPSGTRRVDRGCWQFSRQPEGFRLAARGAPPLTTIEDTVLDLCDRATTDEVIDLLTRAVQLHRTTSAQLLRRLRRRSRSAHRQLITAVLAEVSEGAHSPLELRYLRDVERAHGLPRGRRQAASGPYIRDVLYEEFALVAEPDGRSGHEGTGAFRDMVRDNRTLLAGAATLRFGWSDVAGDPCGTAWLVGEALTQRGWCGEVLRCRRCRLVV